MSKIVIGTQYKENYNTTGEGEPYWKFKGGSEYIVSIPKGMSAWDCYIEVAPLIEYKNEMSEEFILGHHVVGNSYQSEFEKSQLEYEGYPGHSEPRLSKVNGVWKLLEAFENDKGFWKRQWTITKGKERSNFEEIFSNAA